MIVFSSGAGVALLLMVGDWGGVVVNLRNETHRKRWGASVYLICYSGVQFAVFKFLNGLFPDTFGVL